jgi:thiol-disulfide isomerase/thioredoxin
MKNAFKLFIISSLILVSCSEEKPMDYAQFTASVSDSSISEITLNGSMSSKDISVNEDGIFQDTIQNAQGGFYQVKMGNTRTFIFLKNGYDLNLNTDEDGEISFSGEGAGTNQYLSEKLRISQELFDRERYFVLEPDEFQKYAAESRATLDNLVNNAVNLDSTLAANELKDHENFFQTLNQFYAQEHELRVRFAPGKTSPVFENYENLKGGTTSLGDLKGKYVYLDIWATWCGPCKMEMPYLKELEKDFHGKNIHFVSISIDKLNKHQAWKDMIADRELGGIQLFAGEDQSFAMEYNITGIPRFILVDPAGKIVSANAPRPSQQQVIRSLFQSLDI